MTDEKIRYFPITKKCGCCGKEFICHDPKTWAFKKYRINNRGASKLIYFCTWGCLRKWEKELKNEQMP